MKKVILFLLLALSYNAFSQTKEKEKEQSNAEIFSNKAGTLIHKEFFRIGKLKSTEITVVHYLDLNTNDKETALKLTYEYHSSYSSSSDTKIAVLDKDEVTALINVFKLIQEKIITNTPINYTEVSYRSRGGFEAGCYYSKDEWSIYLKLEKYDGNSYVFLKKDNITELLTLLQQAKEKL